ncbi:hypothetical protein DFJ58DRAFT_742663 [Suillus subalutaceus]|uniref:uncharacterized protein n=1 Tax=Suillus subalutaceus TaxID=48586 RepID=UPI001B8636C5|nr:uncharacterized protein DFJ58DRAFT_742663 [Suillus subalutaceus]KAG1868271.1 hypothetical protein DFJ58DRAFT_742663 [Suillus subalutaceus]
MTQSTPHTSSSHGSEPSNAAQYTPNTGMHMDQFPWPHPAYIPHPGLYYPYGVPIAPHGAAPPYAPVVPSPDVGSGVAHHASQTGQHGYYPPAVADVTNVSQYPPLTEAAPPPQHPSAPPLYHQAFPSSVSPGAIIPYAPPTPHQGYLQHHGPGLPTGFTPLFTGNVKKRNVKRTKIWLDKIKDDPLFKPVLDQSGQHYGTYVCSKDGMVIRPGSYKHHITTAKHVGNKLTLFKCPLCPKTYTRRDACKRHWDERCGKLAADGARLSYRAACQRFMSSASASPETMSTEVTEDAPSPDSCAANEIQDLALVAPELPPSEVREITLAEVHENLAFGRWINGIEDFVDPVLPISEPPSSPLPETMLAEAAEDPDVWSLVNEIEDFVDPEIPLCESPADAAEDPDFCNLPIRTLLICSWLNNSYESALHQRSPSELAPLSSALIDHEM